MPSPTATRGRLFRLADEFAAALEASQEAASADMLDAWTVGYWGVRQELDALLAKIERAKVAGRPPGLAWAYQGRRLDALLRAVQAELVAYAGKAASITSTAQQAALASAQANALALASAAVAESLPGLEATLVGVNPGTLAAAVGFLADGTPLRRHLETTLPPEGADKVRATILKGLTLGKGQDWYVRQVTEDLAISHARAETIMRTETIRAYRRATQQTYLANPEVITEWVWHAHLDRACCVACVVMHGTVHPTFAICDGHPRCRCAMLPRTKSWAEVLGRTTGLPRDTRPAVEPGTVWLERQRPATQEALMGPLKYRAWKDGEVELADMVARRDDDEWGTMRYERSLKAIREGRHANWADQAA